jgi:hypothetical protein
MWFVHYALQRVPIRYQKGAGAADQYHRYYAEQDAE